MLQTLLATTKYYKNKQFNIPYQNNYKNGEKLYKTNTYTYMDGTNVVKTKYYSQKILPASPDVAAAESSVGTELLMLTEKIYFKPCVFIKNCLQSRDRFGELFSSSAQYVGTSSPSSSSTLQSDRRSGT